MLEVVDTNAGPIDLPSIMAALARERPVFHNEADLQHAFAWELHTQWPDAGVRLETRPLADVRWFLDVYVARRGIRVAIELKYLTRRLDADVQGEHFALRNHGAQDTRRYDVVKDIARVEQIIDGGAADLGYAVVLSNDPSYWREWTAKDVADAAFRIHHGRVLEGDVAWSARAGPGTRAGREGSISVRGSYVLEWKDYSSVSAGPAGTFRYMLAVVGPTPPVSQEGIEPSEQQDWDDG